LKALDSVSIEFGGGVHAVIGPNGAGKTTLLDVITGFVRPDRGKCFLKGMDITGLPPYAVSRQGIARSFQEVRLVSQETVLDNVLLAKPAQRGEGLWAAILGKGLAAEERRNREEAEHLLGIVGLTAAANRLAGDLSYGEGKLLCLACCLATGASVLLLDEPVAGVHARVAEQIASLISNVAESGKLVVIVEHDISFVRGLADRVIVLDEGRVVAQGAADEILLRPDIMEAFLG
jgi:branched-chain amino acid transport system ATP-binding protein